MEKHQTSFSFIHLFLTKVRKGIVRNGGAFFVRKREHMKIYIPKTIYCPKCGRKVGTWDGRSTINVIFRCRKCNKRIVYHVDTGEVERKDIPKRNCSSGKTFL